MVFFQISEKGIWRIPAGFGGWAPESWTGVRGAPSNPSASIRQNPSIVSVQQVVPNTCLLPYNQPKTWRDNLHPT